MKDINLNWFEEKVILYSWYFTPDKNPWKWVRLTIILDLHYYNDYQDLEENLYLTKSIIDEVKERYLQD